MTRPTVPSILMLLLAAAFAACAEASGEVRGGGEEQDTSAQTFIGCDPTEQIDAGNGTTFADLYRDLFSAGGAGGCGQQACHGTEQSPGAQTSKFVCSDETTCRDTLLGASRLVRPGDGQDPENSVLYTTMRHCDDNRRQVGFMPQTPKNYFFSRKSMDRVKAWIVSEASD